VLSSKGLVFSLGAASGRGAELLDRLCRFWIAGVVKKTFPARFSKGILFYAGIEVKGELRAIVKGGEFAQEVGILDLCVRYFFISIGSCWRVGFPCGRFPPLWCSPRGVWGPPPSGSFVARSS